MEWSNKTFIICHSYKPLSSSPLSYSYHLTFSHAVKWDSRTFLCWILQQNYIWVGHLIILRWIATWVSSERNFSRKEYENFRSHFAKNIKIFSRNFVKTMSFIAAQMNCSEELKEFSALIAQYLKNSYLFRFPNYFGSSRSRFYFVL